MSAAPKTPAALHGKQGAPQSALNAELIDGQPTAKPRQQIGEINRRLAEIAQTEALAAEYAQRVSDAKIDAAGQAIAADIYKRLEAVMADFAIPEEEPMTPDPAIVNAAQKLARCDAELAEANAVMATAQAHEVKLTGQIKVLEGQRQAIVVRRTADGHRPGDGAKLAELVADVEGLAAMIPEANTGLNEACRAVAKRSAARQRAVTDLSRAECASLATHRRARLDEVAALMLALVVQDRADLKRTNARPDWVAPPELLRDLQLRAGERPDLATGGQPGSRFPASAAYRPSIRAA